MSENKLVFTYFDAHSASVELVGNILGILDQFPYPPNPSVLVFSQVVDVLGQLLGYGNESSFVFGRQILLLGQIVITAHDNTKNNILYNLGDNLY
jgi:hypothetical protein